MEEVAEHLVDWLGCDQEPATEGPSFTANVNPGESQLGRIGEDIFLDASEVAFLNEVPLDVEKVEAVRNPVETKSLEKRPAGGKKTREYANAASRKSRLKRKQERKELENRNNALLKEQVEFRKQIATLQHQIQTLKHTKYGMGPIDLKTENLILRAEVKRHKTFIHHINSMMNNFPKYEFTSSEKSELLKDGTESMIGQVLGMCYTSVADSHWNTSTYYPVTKHFEGSKIVCRWQWLPHGSKPSDATRLNLRHDLYNLPKHTATVLREFALENTDYFEEHFQMTCEQLSKLEEANSDHQDLKDLAINFNALSFDDVSIGDAKIGSNKEPSESDSANPRDSNMLRVLQITEKGESRASGKDLDYILLHAKSEELVNRLGFPEFDGADEGCEAKKKATDNATINEGPGGSDKIPVTVYVNAMAPAKLGNTICKVQDGRQRYEGDDPLFSGVVIRQTENNEIVWTGVSSFPIVGENLPWMARFSAAACANTQNSSTGDIPEVCKVGIEITDRWVESKLVQQQSDKNAPIVVD
mmetsp:Transcript_14181/g.16146  ORF Transcript_14181/g.16146 Transcript_14181/m.16146 type:complete len:530 (-) Transcript_14181:2554-4143(-)|eukprot:CAMPEP_0184042520 /NCGR_PEP_ID=MMETSP0955-20130417/66391_1 /TAXON_ID=627963 /ORGANISM="Aplanochytrium sp, Strain PBS07" /LENGTH=529 /DNA_ID=CAMNT_0026333289 /DNA_START=602 /DNA_END=2191 /DNA_ORIENTATION=-